MTAQLAQRNGTLTAFPGLSKTSPIEPFKALKKAKKGSGNGWTACCPAHPDKSPSLWFIEDAGRVGFHCHAGCDKEDILAAMGLTWPDVFADSLTPAVRTEYHRKTLLSALK